MKLGTTEQRNPDSMNIDLMNAEEIVRVINNEDKKIAGAIEKALPEIAQAVDLIVEKIRSGGRLVYVGAGTSGRLGVLDAAECIPTYSSDRVVGILAGGPDAMFVAKEGAEDSKELAVQQLKEIGFSENDVVCGIAASGRTPFVIGAFEYAHELGTKAIAVVNNADSAVAKAADVAIVAVVGPEVVTGSTRMKAGTADKMILNMLSTASMIRLGKAIESVKNTTKKRIVAMIAEVDQAEASRVLSSCGDVKTAIVMIKCGVDEDLARQLLAKNEGIVGKVFESLGIKAAR